MSKGFWHTLPRYDDPAAATVDPATLLRLRGFWLGMFNAGYVAYVEYGHPGVNDVKALTMRAARLLAIAAEVRGYDSAVITRGHDAATRWLSEQAFRGEQAMADATPPDSDDYRAAVELLQRLALKLQHEVATAKPTQKAAAESNNDRVKAYINERVAAGANLADITRDGIAKALKLSGDTVSNTKAWQTLRDDKRKARAPANTEDAIERAAKSGDWSRVKQMQEQEDRRQARKRIDDE
jgi:hypothetical protein